MNRLFALSTVFLILIVSGCSKWVTPFRMYKTDKQTEIHSAEEAMKQKEHVITVNDELFIHVFPNSAEVLINPEFIQSMSATQETMSHRVLSDGSVYLPALGSVNLGGKTISEAEDFLRNEYESYVNNPFVLLKVSNKRVFVHKGGKSGSATSIDLENPNTTLIEALSKAGGIMDGKAHRIYLIRNQDENVLFYEIDMSLAENAKFGNIVLQSNDIIYVVPQPLISRKVIEDITPILTLTTTLLLIYNLFR